MSLGIWSLRKAESRFPAEYDDLAPSPPALADRPWLRTPSGQSDEFESSFRYRGEPAPAAFDTELQWYLND